MDEIPVMEWLKRLNVSKYSLRFAKQKISQISDLRFFGDEGQIETHFGIKDMMLRKRIVNMINGDKLAKENFALLTVNAARTITKAYIKNKKVIDEIVECVETDTISAFELKDVLNQVFTAEGIKEAVKEKVKAT